MSHEVNAAIDAARAGAAVLLEHWERLGKEDADLKARNDWVSLADRDSERAIVSSLRARFPDDSLVGEEGWAGRADSGRTWIIDPLDGTSNYLQHFPVWSVSIGLESGDEIVAGVIYEPLRDLEFTAERGAGAFRNGRRMRVSSQAAVEGAFLATGFPFRAQQYVAIYTDIFRDVISVTK